MDVMGFAEGCSIFRPLLEIDPDALRLVVREAGLAPIDDPSNRDLDYERVRWRALLPQLAALGLDAARLATFARRMDDANIVIAAQTEAAHLALPVRSSAGGVQLPHGRFAALPRAVGVRLLGQVLGEIGCNRKPRALAALESLRDRLVTHEPLKPMTLHGCVVSSDGIAIAVAPEPGRRPALPIVTEAASVTPN